uniref:Uncharacterized protein n=1 Tax=Bostrychia tenella TaxID=324755 RepID=A0A1Z1M660_9FLOR|nr:hypothetical protein [Bostrychia tenella]ARW61343.1 hypothetical protein [Bostrychia tenella]
MQKRITLKKKIDLLLISIESLNIYDIECFSTSKINTKCEKKNKNIIQINQKLRNHYNDKSCNFIQIITYIYTIYIVICHNLLNPLILQTLQKYAKHVKSKEVKQYIKKFTYIYFVKYEHYYNYKCLNYLYRINIDEIAISSLYILKKLQQKKGILLLIKYLSL